MECKFGEPLLHGRLYAELRQAMDIRRIVIPVAIVAVSLWASPADAFRVYSVFDSNVGNAATKIYPLSIQSLDEVAAPPSTAEAAEVPVPSGAFSSLGCVLRAAPGLGKSWAFTLLLNGVPTSLTCPISNTTTERSCNFGSSVTTAVGDRVALKVEPTSTPTATNLRCTLHFSP